jgi:hypothetical protein
MYADAGFVKKFEFSVGSRRQKQEAEDKGQKLVAGVSPFQPFNLP